MKALAVYAVVAAGSMMASAAHAQQSAFPSSSPISAGRWIIAGSAALSSSHDETNNQTVTSARLSPSGLVFVRPRLALGGTATGSYFNSSGSSSTIFGLGPSARYYFGDPAGQLFPFVSASVAPQWQRVHPKNAVVVAGTTISSPDLTARTIAIDGSLGLTRLLATNVGVTGEAYYTHLGTKVTSGSTAPAHNTHDLGLRFGLTVFVH